MSEEDNGNVHSRIYSIVSKTQQNMGTPRNTDEIPIYNNPSSSTGGSKKRRRNSKSLHSIDIQMFHFPGHDPMGDEYQLSDLELAVEFKFSISDVTTEKIIQNEIITQLQKKYPLCKREHVDKKWIYYEKVKYKQQRIKKIHFSTDYKLDGKFLRSLAKGEKPVYLILTTRFPGSSKSSAPLPRPSIEIDNPFDNSDLSSDSDLEVPIWSKKQKKTSTTSNKADRKSNDSSGFLLEGLTETPSSSTVPQSCSPTLPEFLNTYPFTAIKGVCGEGALVSLIQIFLHSTNLIQTLFKISEKKIKEHSLSDFETLLLQLLHIEVFGAPVDVTASVLASYHNKMDTSEPRSFLQHLESMEMDLLWEDNFSPSL